MILFALVVHFCVTYPTSWRCDATAPVAFYATKRSCETMGRRVVRRIARPSYTFTCDRYVIEPERPR